MFCYKCGKKIANDSVYCNYCGTKTNFIQVNKDDRNPILNSPADITSDLIKRIIDNDLDSLTINYEFTRARPHDYKKWSEWENELYRTNPFIIANQEKSLRRIEFEIRLGNNVRSLAHAFMRMKDLEFVNLKDTSMITDMSGTFEGALSFNQPIGNWDTSNVTNMHFMFFAAKSFNQPIGNWDVSSVTDMSGMFMDAILFNQPIGNWDVSSVIDMSEMFASATGWGHHKFDQPIGAWNTSNVTDMTRMFDGSRCFNQPIGEWDVSKVKNMDSMFKMSRFNQNISRWDVSKVTNMHWMFYQADFNQDISMWNTSNVTNFFEMFEEAAYNHPKPRGA